MTINSEIHTTLTLKEVSYICAAISGYLRVKKEDGVNKEMIAIADRLGRELYSYPDNDFTKNLNKAVSL